VSLSEEEAARALSFGRRAADYERVRPTYPVEAVRWLTEDIPGRSVVDVGAGTGKMSRVLQAAGLDVTAVEPDPDMRAILSTIDGITVRAGRGESLPVSAADAVVYAQSWHWTDPVLAAAEALRVLAPGGLLGLAWNFEDGSVDWVKAIGEATGEARSTLADGAPSIAQVDGFAPGEELSIPWADEVTVDDLVTLVSTWSWVSTMPDEERTAVLRSVRSIASEVARDDVVVLPRICLCRRARAARTL
jgi:SAM-dependent methyltransferase